MFLRLITFTVNVITVMKELFANLKLMNVQRIRRAFMENVLIVSVSKVLNYSQCRCGSTSTEIWIIHLLFHNKKLCLKWNLSKLYLQSAHCFLLILKSFYLLHAYRILRLQMWSRMGWEKLFGHVNWMSKFTMLEWWAMYTIIRKRDSASVQLHMCRRFYRWSLRKRYNIISQQAKLGDSQYE